VKNSKQHNVLIIKKERDQRKKETGEPLSSCRWQEKAALSFPSPSKEKKEVGRNGEGKEKGGGNIVGGVGWIHHFYFWPNTRKVERCNRRKKKQPEKPPGHPAPEKMRPACRGEKKKKKEPKKLKSTVPPYTLDPKGRNRSKGPINQRKREKDLLKKKSTKLRPACIEGAR